MLKLKYCIFKTQDGKFEVGYTRDWNYHYMIRVPKNSELVSAGYFMQNQTDLDKITTYGSSQGYGIGPGPDDERIIAEYLENEECQTVREFYRTPEPAVPEVVAKTN